MNPNGRRTVCLVTGATGFVGSHVTERCLREGFRVRTLVRPTSDVSLLSQWPVERIVGDLTDRPAVRRALEGATLVFHCAAKVADWGPASQFWAENVRALEVLLDEACRQPLERFIHVSSLSVYRHGHHFGTDETVEPTVGADAYAASKIEAERLVMRAYRERGLPVTVFRPGYIYGPRDRSLLPALLESLGRQRLMYFGNGRQAVNSIYVGNLVHAMMLCLSRPASIGQIYNISDGQGLYKRKFIDTIAELAGYRRPQRSVPLWLAQVATACFEGVHRVFRLRQAPLVNRARLKFLGFNLDFSIEKARRELGYAPVFDFRDGLKESIEWFRAAGKLPPCAGRGPGWTNGRRVSPSQGS